MAVEKASFRDPEGYVFLKEGEYYRQVNMAGKDNYDLLKKSGLLKYLIDKGLLISHEETKIKPAGGGYIVIKPVQIPFISYPYEWSFSMLKDAALLTLQIQELALKHGMVLKDSSAYNVQFIDGKPIFIDTLSFEKFENQTWAGYKQFCQHFLAPLSLMSSVDLRLGNMLRDYIDGIPLDLAASILPKQFFVKPGIAIHLWMHSKAQKRYADTERSQQVTTRAVPINQMLAQADSLRRTVSKLELSKKIKTEWGEYYTFTNYDDKSFTKKKKIVENFIKKMGKPNMVWDMGGNDGTFTRVALKSGAKNAICFDIDPIATEKNYRAVRAKDEKNVLPLVLDLTNPSPSIGWGNSERSNIAERSSGGVTTMALALIHHLAISNNLPFSMIADYFARFSDYLIIEFVPKSDSKVKILLSSREDIFNQYNQKQFEGDFSKFFKIVDKEKVRGSERTLYLMRKK